MDWAERVSQLSHARRLQVGSVIVKDDTVISYGFNGTPAGWDNNCEEELIVEQDEKFVKVLKTKPEVMHSERNALDKLARQGNVGGYGADIFITHAPCLECAKSILGAGIKNVYFGTAYRDVDGVEFLKKSGIGVTHIDRK
jgi:dCMP deaminase